MFIIHTNKQDFVAFRQLILERSLKRLEWEKAREREEKEAADAAEKERVAMQMIDWCVRRYAQQSRR